jgi:hypothetical protein
VKSEPVKPKPVKSKEQPEPVVEEEDASAPAA